MLVRNRCSCAMEYHRHMPIGAEVQKGGGVHFRVWSTTSSEIGVRVSGDSEVANSRVQIRLSPEGNEYFSGYLSEAKPGDFYKFVIDDRLFPDPAARAQYGGPHGPSVVVDPETYIWHDKDWAGILPESHVIYEMHLGTFTHAATWAAGTLRGQCCPWRTC